MLRGITGRRAPDQENMGENDRDRSSTKVGGKLYFGYYNGWEHLKNKGYLKSRDTSKNFVGPSEAGQGLCSETVKGH